MLISKCKKCKNWIGAYSATNQVIRCSNCGSLTGFKGSKLQQMLLFAAMLIAMMAFTNYEYQSIISYYSVGIFLFFTVYLVSLFTFSPCNSAEVRFRFKIKEFNFNRFVLSNLIHALLFSIFIPFCFYFLGGVIISRAL
ncbi:hypothetical protein CXF72_05120 [Psychromonas sp. MB-3u-54]|nr:hypothetical protein CXF72_05120 [Psychromonas sp. MB-3u-54]